MSEELLKRLQAELQADKAKVEADQAALSNAENTATVTIRCIVAFGNFQKGDTVDIPAGTVFDKTYFEAT
jgi:hypothetical protein